MAGRSTRVANSDSNGDIQQANPARFPSSASIQARVVFGEVTYFALTENQIGNYVALGWLVTASVTLASMCFEAAFGCWLALTQGGISSTSSATIGTVMWVASASGLIMAVCAGIFWWLKARNKQGWLTNTVQLEQ
jgi:hypothetical protein